MSYITDLALRRGSVTVLAFIIILAAGIFTFTSLPVEVLPRVQFPLLTVNVDYPNAGSEEVVQAITEPLEQHISGLGNLESIQSTSVEGKSILLLFYEYGSDMDQAKKDLETRLKNVETYVSQIELKSSKQRGEDFKRYKKRITELLEDVSLDEQRLLQEVAIIAEKKDISEEIVRLGSHIQLYNTYFDDVEYAGRKMNFMLQEMGREVNTVGSKTDQIEVSHLVVSVKDELEKMREQVQNIL